MKKIAVITACTLTAMTIAAGLALAGGTWVAKHGSPAHIEMDGAEAHDLTELHDGETRIFGSGDRAITATRDGDLVTLSRDGRVTSRCHVDTDECTIYTFDDDPARINVTIERQIHCDGDDEDCNLHEMTFAMHAGEHGAIPIIEGWCAEGDDGEDCAQQHMSIVVLETDDGGETIHEDIHVMRIPGGSTVIAMGEGPGDFVDLAEELLDGETRIFGGNDGEVTAVRSGDEIRLTREADDDHKSLDVTCRVGVDVCKVMTFEDDPDKAMVMIEKRRHCEGDDCSEGPERIIRRKRVRRGSDI